MREVCMYTPSARGGHALYSKELLTSLALETLLKPTLITSRDTEAEFSDVPYEVVKLLPELEEKSTFRHRSAWLIERTRHYWQRETRFLEWLRGQPDIDVVHFQEFTPWLAPHFFTKFRHLGKKLVYTVHNVRPHSKRVLTWFYRKAWLHCDALIVHSDSLKQDLSQLLGARHPPIFVIPHGVWSSTIETDMPNFSRRLSQRNLLFFGVIRENKGLHHLLDAMLELNGFKLTIAGSAKDHRSYFEREILPRIDTLRAKGISIDLQEGFVPDSELASLFLNSSALILPYENFSAQSGVLYLALAHELPVIASRAGALGETVEALECGLVLGNCVPKAIVNAVQDLHEGEGLATLEANLKRARQDFSWSRAAKLTAATYQHVSGNSPWAGQGV